MGRFFLGATAFVVVALISATCIASPAIDEAKRLFARNQNTAALATLERAAQTGDAEAANYLGQTYQLGLAGVKADAKRACGLYEQASNLGFASAHHNFANCFLNASGRKRDYARARVLFEKAAQAGIVASNCSLGFMYIRALGVSRDDEQGIALCRKAAELGDVQAMMVLVDYYLDRRYVNANTGWARYWLERAAAKGDAVAYRRLAQLYIEGRGWAREDNESIDDLKTAYRGGNKPAAFKIAQIYLSMPPQWRNDTRHLYKAFHWFCVAGTEDPDPARRQEAHRKQGFVLGILHAINDIDLTCANESTRQR